MVMKAAEVLCATCAVFLAGVSAQPAAASSATVLYSFPYNYGALGRLLQLDAGTIYGTSLYGKSGYGAVYQLKQKRGQWNAKEITSFSAGKGGRTPYAGVIRDPSTGALFGTTVNGGAKYGTVYALRFANRAWSKTILHNFNQSDGAFPYGMLLRDKVTGTLFGTTYQGGSAGCGTAFQLDEQGATFNVLYSFHGGADGCRAETQLRAGPNAGTLVGSTDFGGSADMGTVFLLAETGGVWNESVQHAFTGDDGCYPLDLAVSGDGTVYGVTSSCGIYGYGTVFQIRNVGGRPKFSTLYNFTGGTDGNSPVGIQRDDPDGILYGATRYGGASGQGVVFSLHPNSGGQWTETVLHSFAGGTDGSHPVSRPILDQSTGHVLGTTLDGGQDNNGVIYGVTP
jgi:uncharacterized repeat protein (TIGR03803 family)